MTARFLAALACAIVSAGVDAASQDQSRVAPQPIRVGFGQGAYELGPGVVPPVLVRTRAPEYTAEALRDRIEGVVTLEAVVRVNGTVGEVRIVRAPDVQYGLDQAAAEAAKRHLFRPGRVNGHAVAVIVTLEFTFRLPYREPARPAATAATTSAEFGRGAYGTDTPQLVVPIVIRTVDGSYTAEAMRRKIQGEVEVEAVVLPNGTVGEARVLKSLDAEHGLDEEALRAAKKWLFKSGRLNEQAVPVRVILILTFRLH
jgi:TonB family protein